MKNKLKDYAIYYTTKEDMEQISNALKKSNSCRYGIECFYCNGTGKYISILNEEKQCKYCEGTGDLVDKRVFEHYKHDVKVSPNWVNDVHETIKNLHKRIEELEKEIRNGK